MYEPVSDIPASMDRIEIVSTLSQTDWRAYQMAWANHLQRSAKSSRFSLASFLIVVLVSLLLATIVSTWLRSADGGVQIVAFVLGAALTLATMIVVQRRLQKNAAPDAEGAILGQCTIAFDAHGIHVTKPRAKSSYQWSVLRSSTLTTEHLFLWIDRVAGLIVPLRDLPSDLTPTSLAEHITRLSGSATHEAEDTLSPTRPERIESAATHDERSRTPWRAFVTTCMRLWTLRTVDARAFVLPDGITIAVLVSCVGAMFATDWLLMTAPREFVPYGVLASSWYIVGMMLIAWTSARLSEPQIEFSRVAVLIVMFLPIVVAARLLLSLALSERTWLLGVLVAGFYGVLILERGLRSMTVRAQPRALAASMLLTTLLLWSSQHFYASTQLFYSAEEREFDASATHESFLELWRTAESTLFAQAQRIQDEVDAFEPSGASAPSGYFVGFAGMGEQRVFAGEVALAQSVIAKHFQTGSRSVALVNDRRDLQTHPLASPTALRYTLAAVAEKMNVDRDVLFLSLSSHGGADGVLSVSNAGLPLNNLSAEDLAAALDESRIRWRVIVVSACYAGKFIEPLRNDNTIVIAAAAADKTSFGCSDDREITYFGEAFYRDALSGTADLRSAFELATKAIVERETREGLEPSSPQAHFGTAIERHLGTLSRS